MMKKSLIACLSFTAFGFSAHAQPANNNCANATLITPGSYSGTTVGATNDGNSGCGSSNTTPDVWYRITPPTDRRLVVQTCGGASWDTVLAIHSGCPGTTSNVLACNDDSCGLQSVVSANVTGGQTYYIRVSGYAGSTGAFTITVSLEDPPPPPTHGPDVTVFNLIDMAYYGTVGGINAYAIGTDACNIGDAPVSWYSTTNQHPVIAQNMYRLLNGRFEQIGMSWLKHGFASTNSPGCGTCQPPPDGGAQLGVSCTDAYGSGLNGSQGNLGPRSEVNATSGYYPFPFGGAPYSGVLARRLQVLQSDVNPTTNAGALYFAECQYVAPDDANWNNGLNNNTWRRISVPLTGTPSFVGPSVTQQPAIHAWAANDPTVVLANADYLEGTITARFVVGAKVTNNGNGTWNYEYAIQNINSHRSAGSVTVPMTLGVSVNNIGFHDVFYHSGEPYSGTDWTTTRSAGGLTWSTEPYAMNQNANALRWSTLYNYRFTANVPPTTGSISIGLFRPGTPASITANNLPVPSVPPPSCDPDVNCDGSADGFDVETMEQAVAGDMGNFCQPDADFNHDGSVDGFDVETVEQIVGGAPCP
jgi:hypothetical protein